jgi:type IV secretory pathway protease TraF
VAEPLPTLAMHPEPHPLHNPTLVILPYASDPHLLGELVFFEPPDALQAIVAQRQAVAAATVAPTTLFVQDGTAASPSATRAPLQPQSPPSLFEQQFQKRQLFVKRIVGLPGDTVAVDRSGTVSVDGRTRGDGSRTRPPPLLEDLLPTSSELVVPDSAYFVAGDNSDVSIDSRVWGSLPQVNVVGRPLLRVLPLSRFGKVE